MNKLKHLSFDCIFKVIVLKLSKTIFELDLNLENFCIFPK
ncbi:hypothetical protein LEP1GSC034_2706 [Leptospira interrogans str. 2003000735]|uniref:Uncharacterized protein n=2 Tax=Leptospira interrogans TaxID=173 RepID=A0A829DC13_LEPIR|nr:hypothetical protein LEP1GSC027_2054 [Leptospira interrogans str. 2002000624]EKP87379.1 hypothetical protein LEP1GSC020_0007 [Leptospira interrogans serovar Grippotyphosa str. 2006006986]EKQ39837.1 hypothetical protein LEP1GSC025_0294 [Leptospira interrogans str. 2002000621]EKQ47331.1 hypothetical protein LEP1GSC026_1252 [Leptospira interrogans str. 2002000623]EMJ58810.1 hypothetical protein LEP1GSC013_1220 [Leptospira interrogans serovar Valbuzzi str. Duyster]EMJ67941.1 hypothetical protei